MRRNVRLLTAYEVFAGLIPFLAVWVVYLTDYRDLTLAQVRIMEGVFWGIKIVAEMSTRSAARLPVRRLTSGPNRSRALAARSKPGSTEPATRFGCRDTQTGAPLKLG